MGPLPAPLQLASSILSGPFSFSAGVPSHVRANVILLIPKTDRTARSSRLSSVPLLAGADPAPLLQLTDNQQGELAGNLL
jgi:hypothetical protein